MAPQGDELEITADSGAADSVLPETWLHELGINATAKTGMVYAAANGQPIVNQGARVVRGTTTNGTMLSIPFNVAQVHKALASVSHMVEGPAQ